MLKRFVFNDGYGAAFAMSSVGLVYNSATGKPLASYAELWEPRFRKRFLMTSPKSTQSLYLLIAALSVETGKPYAEAQYLIEKSWDKMEALKPNVLSIFETAATVMQVAQGQADIAGLSFSKSVYPYTVKGAPIDMCFPKEGTFAGINCLTLVKGAPDRELGIAFINRMLDPGGAAGTGRGDLRRSDDLRPGVQAGRREIHGLSGRQDGRDGDLQPGLDLHQPDPLEAAGKIQSGVRRMTERRRPPLRFA